MKSIFKLGVRLLCYTLFIGLNINPMLAKDECNLILNSNFSNAPNEWIAALTKDKGVEGSVTFVNQNASFVIDAIGENKFDVSLEQRGLHIQEGESYQIRFIAKVKTPKTISVAVTDIGNKYLTLSNSNKDFDLTAEQTVYEYAFNAHVTDYTTRLIFMLGKDTADIVIDDVSMIKLNCENCLPKGTVCDDKDACTVNDKEDGLCNCAGELTTNNQIINGDFSDNFYNGWRRTIHTPHGAKAKLVFDNKEAHFEIEKTGVKNWNIALEQRNLSIEADKHYKISFKAKATEARDINVKISDVGGIFATYFSQDVTLTDNFQDYTFNYEAPVTDTEVRIIFNLGLDTPDVTIDDVYFEQYNCEPCDQYGLACDDGNSCTINDKYNAACECVSYTKKEQYIYNGSFSSQFAGWVNTIYADSGAVATATFEDKLAHFKIEKDGTRNWHISVEQRGIPFVAGENYLISFRAKATIGRLMNIKISNYPYANLTYFNQDLTLMEDWKAYQYSFSPETNDNFTRIIFNMGIDTLNNSVNEIFIDDVSISNTACSQYSPVLPQDSLVLLQFYEQSCQTDCKLEWNLSRSVHTWEGVEIENERVIALKLASKNLSGNIPFLDLSELKELDLSNNNFDGTLGDFSNLNQLIDLNVSKNQLSFEAVESNLTANFSINKFVYSPQYIGEEETYFLNKGQYWWIGSVDEQLTNTEGLSFQWKHNNKEIENAVIDSFRIENMQVEDIGIYTLHISNESLVPDMKIISKPNYVLMPGYDINGQEIYNNEIMVLFDDLEETNYYTDLFINENDNARVSFQCNCDRELYLWQFDSSEEASRVLLDIDKRREVASPRGEVRGNPNQQYKENDSNNVDTESTSSPSWKWPELNHTNLKNTVNVYLLDTGLDLNNLGNTSFLMEEAPASCIDENKAPGYSYVTAQNKINTQYQDSNGHGTYGYNAITGGMDVNSNLKVVPIKLFDDQGEGSIFHFICGLFHSIDNNADIINVSAGFKGGNSSILESALQIAQQKGIFITAAAGNDGVNMDSIPQYPAYYAGKSYQKQKFDVVGAPSLDENGNPTFDLILYDNIISIASLNSQNELSEFSNYGIQSVTLSAYGENLISNGLNGKVDTCSGTSMATFFTTRELVTEIGKDKSRTYQQIWSDFEENYLIENENTIGKTKTGKQVNVSLEPVQLKISQIEETHSLIYTFPNPSNGKVSLVFDCTGGFLNSTDINISVFDIFGVEVYKHSTPCNPQIRLDMNGINKGTYIIKASNLYKNVYGKIIIK